MIGSTLGVLESDEDGKECQLPMSNLFPHNQLIPLREAALPFPRYCRRFQGLKSVQCQAFGKAKVCQECQNGQVRIP